MARSNFPIIMTQKYFLCKFIIQILLNFQFKYFTSFLYLQAKWGKIVVQTTFPQKTDLKIV